MGGGGLSLWTLTLTANIKCRKQNYWMRKKSKEKPLFKVCVQSWLERDLRCFFTRFALRVWTSMLVLASCHIPICVFARLSRPSTGYQRFCLLFGLHLQFSRFSNFFFQHAQFNRRLGPVTFHEDRVMHCVNFSSALQVKVWLTEYLGLHVWSSRPRYTWRNTKNRLLPTRDITL